MSTNQTVTDTMRQLAASETLGTPGSRTTECPLTEALLEQHVAANPQETAADMVKAVQVFRRNPVAGRVCDIIQGTKPIIEKIQQLIADIKKLCPTQAPTVPGAAPPVGCQGALCKMLSCLCPTCPSGANDCGCGQDCCPAPNPGPDDGQKNG
jgi:translation initiation factor 1 (eIF-1/SUI1)